MADLSGINLAMQTTFNSDGSVDFDAYAQLIDQYIDAGVHGLVLGAGTGQHPYLTEEECNKLYEVGIKKINKRCNVICQTSALNVDEVIRRSQHAESLGADALMILPPYFEGPEDDDSIFEFYQEIDSSVNIDIIGYNIPQATHLPVSVDLLKRLGELKNYNYIKDSGGDLTVHQQYLETGVAVLNGCDTTTIYAFMAGAVGTIWGGANYMPHEAVELYNAIQCKDYSKAFSLWNIMLPSLLHIWTSEYTPCVLRASYLRGFGTGNLRKPLKVISEEKDKALQESLAPLI